MQNEEYLKRNLAVCNAIGIKSGAYILLEHVKRLVNSPLWLRKGLEGIADKAVEIIPSLVEHREEVSPYLIKKEE